MCRSFGEIFFRKAQSFQYADDLAFTGVAVPGIEFGLKAVVGLEPFFQLPAGEGFQFQFDCPDPALHLKDILPRALKFLVDRAAGEQVLMLGQISQCFPLARVMSPPSGSSSPMIISGWWTCRRR